MPAHGRAAKTRTSASGFRKEEGGEGKRKRKGDQYLAADSQSTASAQHKITKRERGENYAGRYLSYSRERKERKKKGKRPILWR